MSAELWEHQRRLTFMAHRTAGVEPYQRTELEIDVIANISPILVFRYFSSRHSCSGTRAVQCVCKAFCQAAEAHNPSPPTPPQDPRCRGWMLSCSHLSRLLGSYQMLHYPGRRGVSTERYFYYSPKGGYTELCCELTLLLCSPLLPRTRWWTPRRN